MINQLTDDKSKAEQDKGSVKVVTMTVSETQSNASKDTEATEHKSKVPEYNPEYDVEKLTEEKESEIKSLLA